VSFENWKWYYLKDPKNPNEATSWVSVTWSELLGLSTEGTITSDTMVTWEELNAPGFPFRYIDAEYFFHTHDGTIRAAYSESELHGAVAEEKLNSSATVWGRTLPAKGIKYENLRFSSLTLVPDLKAFIEMRRGSPITILSGPNNAGKTLLLKLLRKEFGPVANLLACNRFYHFERLNPATQQRGEYVRRHENFVNQLFQQRQNMENSDFPLQQVISEMKNTQRTALLNLCTEMLGQEFKLAQEDDENELSPFHIAVGGENLAIASTGTRLLVYIVAACLDDRFSICLIDEPELGLSPRLQSVLSKYLLGEEFRNKYSPHIEQLFIATHSHIFLDRNDFSNNFVVTRSDDTVSISPTDSVIAFHDLQFNMLGYDLESLFLPSAIVVVEGKTDRKYIRRVLEVFLPEKRIAVVPASGDGKVPDRVLVIKESLVDLMTSPYRKRIFILLDSKHTVRENSFAKYGIPNDNIVVWEKNGIEFYYPPEILAELFHCDTDAIAQLEISGNVVRMHGIEMTKAALCDAVVGRLTASSTLPEEFRAKFLEPVMALVD